MFYLNENARVGRLSDLLPWYALIHGPTPTVILNKGRVFQATLAYRGEHVPMAEPEAPAVDVHRLNPHLRRLGTGWGLLADQWHEPTTAYPTSVWSNPAACFVDAARRALFTSGVLHESHQFLTLCWQPPSQLQAKWYDQWFQTTTAKTTNELQQDLESFVHALVRWGDGLMGLFPAWHWLNPEDTLTYLQRCVTWHRCRVGLPEIPIHLASRLATDDWLPGHTPRLGSSPTDLRLLRPLEIQQWPKGRPEDGGGLGMEVPLALQGLPFPYRFTVRYLPLDKADAETAVGEYERKWGGLMQDNWPWWLQWAFPAEAVERSGSATRALEALRANEVSYGYTTPTVLVWGDTEEELSTRERETVKVLQGAGLVVAKDMVNACQAWLGSLPGDLTHNVRNPLLPSLGVAFLLPHATVWAGPEHDEHFQDVPLFTTSSTGTPFRFVLHQGEVGNGVIIGPTRAGKSALLGFMAMQFLRYGADTQVFIFDRDLSLYCATVMAGGSHYILGGNAQRGFQPLGLIDESDAERRWAHEWLQDILLMQGLELSPTDKEEMWLALLRLTAFPRPMRQLRTFYECLQIQRLKHGLTAFLEGGPYSFFDATEDNFTIDPWTCFEMNALLELPGAVPPALQYIFHRLDKRFEGHRSLVVLDEAWRLLSHSIFAPRIAEWIKSKAKKNVSVLLESQEIFDLDRTELWEAIQASCRTTIFLPNSGALNRSVFAHYKAYGLSDAHIRLIAQAKPKQDYLYRSDEGTRMFQLVLSPVERLLCAASSVEEIQTLQALEQQTSKEPLPAAWLRANLFGHEADIFTESYRRNV